MLGSYCERRIAFPYAKSRSGISGRKKRANGASEGTAISPKPRWARGLNLREGQLSHLSVYHSQLFREAELAETVRTRAEEHPFEAYPIANPEPGKRVGRRSHITLDEARDSLQVIADANARRATEFLAHPATAQAVVRIQAEVTRTIEAARRKKQQEWQTTMARLFGTYEDLQQS